MKIFFLFFYLLTLCLSFAEERKYYEEWYYSGVKINFGILNNKEPFPYHPSQKEFNKARSEGAFADITVKVIDEYGHPVENAKVSFLFQMDSLGYTGKPDNDYLILTDSNGCAHTNSKCDGILSLDVSKDKWYYTGLTTMCFFYFNNISLQDGKWQPYGMTHTIVLRKIKNPIPLISKINGFKGVFPERGKPVGLDFFVYDWVAPYGRGKTADVFLQYDIIENAEGRQEKLTFTFPNKGDGFCRLPCMKWSTYKSVYNAPVDNEKYQDNLFFVKNYKYSMERDYHGPGEYHRVEQLVYQNNINDDDQLILRTRTKVDEKGNVVSCHYTKVLGEVWPRWQKEFHMTWFTNPTPNDTNLEEDESECHPYEELLWHQEQKRRQALIKQALRDRAAGKQVEMPDFEEKVTDYAKYIADAETTAAVSKVVSDFIETVKAGDLEKALAFFDATTPRQTYLANNMINGVARAFRTHIQTIDNVCFVTDNVAIIARRQAIKEHPDIFGLSSTALVRKEGKWLLLADSLRVESPVNGLDKESMHKLSLLSKAYRLYSKEVFNSKNKPNAARQAQSSKLDVEAPKPPHVNQASLAPQVSANAKPEENKPQEAEPVADKATAEAVSKVVNDFVEALKAGDKGKAMGLFDARSDEQKQHVEKWLSKAIPFFMSGNVQTAAEPICFALGDAAVVPARQWRTDQPERFEIEITCLARRDGQWRLLADFENAGAAVNGLAQKTLKDFERLREAFMNYKGKKKAEMKR